jgi:hypothetical protein
MFNLFKAFFGYVGSGDGYEMGRKAAEELAVKIRRNPLPYMVNRNFNVPVPSNLGVISSIAFVQGLQDRLIEITEKWITCN